MPRYYARIGEQHFGDGSVLIVREDGTRDFVLVKTQQVLLKDRETAQRWTKEEREREFHEVFPIEPSMQVDEGL